MAEELRAQQLFQLYEDYYLREIFNIEAVFALVVYSEILKVTPSAIVLDTDFLNRKLTDILDRELIALNSELFGLAWLDYNYKLVEEGKQDSSQCDVTLYTEIMHAKSFLENTESGNIWSAAGFYNHTILEAAIAQQNSINWSIPRDMPAYYERATHSSYTTKLEDLSENYDKLLNDKECSLRLSNRLQSVQSWRDGIMIPQKLSLVLAERLSLTPNTETIFLLQRLTVGLYQNARDYINAVIHYGSWELARKEAIDLRQWLFKVVHEALEKQEGSNKTE